MFRVQAEWTLTLHWAVSCKSPWPLAKKNAAVRPELLAHIVFNAFVNYESNIVIYIVISTIEDAQNVYPLL
jgi:hypothetical protein